MIAGFTYTDIGILGLAILLCSVILISKNMVQIMTALLCILALVGIVFLFQHSGFLFLTQLLIYIGGITVFLIFTIMLSKRVTNDKSLSTANQNVFAALLIGVGLVGLFYLVFQSKDFNQDVQIQSLDEIKGLGINTMTTFLFPFELLAILLLIALIMASVIAGKKNEI